MKNRLKKKTKFFKVSLIGVKFVLFIFFASNFLHSQELVKIHGLVKDSLSNPIDLVTVILFDTDNKYISNYRTKDDGKFIFELQLEKRKYFLKFKSLSYKANDILININENVLEYHVVMYSEITELDEVVVNAKQPVKIKKDTVAFKASSFVKKTDDVLEDLLKNLPGFQIDEDGTVKVNGKSINKILIGGDDIFDNNYKIATKNIDAKDIEEVEIIYNFNENSVLRAITQSEDIAINISIKKERLGAIYGKTNLGYGNDNNYLADLTLFKLDKRFKTFLISKTNTVGARAQDNLNSSMFSRSGTNIFDKYQAFSDNVLTTDAVSSNSLINESYLNDNESYFNSFHIFTKPKSNIHVRSIIYFLNDDIERKNAFNAFYTTPPVFNISQSKFFQNDTREFNAELNIKNANGSKSFIEYNGILNNSKQTTNIDLTIDQNQYNENLSIKDYYLSQQLNTTFRINKKNALSLNLFYLQDKNPQFYTTTNPIIDNQGVISQTYENSIRHFGFNSKLINTKNEWNFGFLNKDEKLVSKILNDGSELQFEDYDFSNNIKYNNKDIFVFRKYNFFFGQNYDLSIETKLGYNSVKYKNLSEGQYINKSNYQFYIEPELKLSKEIDNFGKFNFVYKFSYKQPKISDIYNGLLLTSNRGFSQGVNSLFNLYLHRSTLSYSVSDFRKNIFMTSSISYNYSQNTFGYEYINTPDFDILIKEKADNNSLVMTSLKINKNISSIKSGFFLEYGGVYRRSFVEISDQKETAFNNVNNFVAKYGSYFSGKLNIKSGVKLQLSKFKTSNINNKNTQYSSFFQLIYELKEDFIFSLDTKQVYPSKFNNIDKVYNFIDFELKYLAIKNKLDFKLAGQNLTNIKSFQNSYITLVSNTNTNVFFNKAFVTLSASYRF